MTEPTSLRTINLNMLPILREVLRRRNVTQAAEALNVSQSVVSEALSRARRLLEDELLVADGRQMRLTERAHAVYETLDASLTDIEALLSDESLDIASESGVIRIATADYVVHAFGLRLIERVAKAAPRLTVQFVDIGPHSSAALSRGAIDFILTPALIREPLEAIHLFDDRAVCIVPNKSGYGEQLTDEEFWSARHAAFTPGDAILHSMHKDILQQVGREEFNAVIVQTFLLLPMILEAAGAIALIPERLAKTAFVQSRSRIALPPLEFPVLRVQAYWHSSATNDPVHMWMREQMSLTAAEA